MRVTVIVNPAAGTAEDRWPLDAARRELSDAGHHVDVRETSKQGDAERLAREATGLGADVIVAAGGEILHFGMPVDPGNLLLLGRLDGRPVLGLPGCCRSPKRNGFDWVLERLAAGLEVTGRDIMRMGVGGLLSEIPSRPQPREIPAAGDKPARVAALVLAAGPRGGRRG